MNGSLRPNITLSYGLRFETQNAIHDHGDWAPRVAIAWGIDGDRQADRQDRAARRLRTRSTIASAKSSVLNTNRLNGVTQQQLCGR